jgi:hypothetical protein
MNNAKFSGLPQIELQDDGRTVRLLEDFSFTDTNGNVWQSKKDELPDGSSIPKLFWTFVGSPFVGKHRLASIPHDTYCKLREKSGKTYQEVHRMYYEACIAAGVKKHKAKLMYKAIKLGGPKW